MQLHSQQCAAPGERGVKAKLALAPPPPAPRRRIKPRAAPRKPRVAAHAVLQPAELVALAAAPVAKIAAMCAVGATCARQGLLPPEGRRMLSGLVMNVFTPALLLSKLGAGADLRQVLALWPVAANMAAAHAAGAALGLAQVRVLRVPEGLRDQTVVLSTLGNVGNIPLVLVPSLLASLGASGAGGGGEAAAAAAASAAAEAGVVYVMLGFFVASLIQFPIGWLMLQRPEPPPLPPQSAQLAAEPAAAAAAAAPAAAAAAAAGASSGWSGGGAAPPAAAAAAAAALAAPGAQRQATQQALEQQRQAERAARLKTIAKGVFTPPVIACLIAVPVASIPELKAALFTPSGALAPVGDVIALLGAPLIPCLFLVLGANLAEGPGSAQVPARLIVGSCATKLVLHPLAGAALVAGCLRLGLLPADLDPAAVLVMVLVWATPTAVLVHALATMMQNGADQVAAVLFWQYLASLVTLPAFMGLVLQLYVTGQLSPAAAGV